MFRWIIIASLLIQCKTQNNEILDYESRVKKDFEVCIADDQKLDNKDQKIIFLDGIFDLPHLGHQAYIRSARELAEKTFNTAKIFILIGISGTPEEIKKYKRDSVMTFSEKKQTLCGFRFVNKVINSPMITTEEFMKKYNIDLVIAGGDYKDMEKARPYYNTPILLGKFATTERNLPMSTSAIMQRVAIRLGEIISSKTNNLKDKKAISRFLKLMHEGF